MICSPLAKVEQFVGGQRYRPLRSGRSYLATYASARFRSRPMWRLHATSWLRYCAEGDSRRGMADSRYQRAGVQREHAGNDRSRAEGTEWRLYTEKHAVDGDLWACMFY